MSEHADDSAQEKGLDPEKHLRRMWQRAPLLAQAKANRVYMEEFRKTMKAKLMRASGEKTGAGQEIAAYSHPDYIAHLEGLKVAVEHEEVLRWRMVTDQASVEVWRSTEASNRVIDRSAR